MSKTTKIQWCDSTVNPTMGCDGCELWNPATGTKICYAGVLHDRYGGKTKGYSPTFGEVTTWAGRMKKAAEWSDLSGIHRPDKPWLNGLPRLIFVSDMSDAFSDTVTFDYLREEVIAAATSKEGRRHRYLWLTKRPHIMAKFSRWLEDKGGWPENIWAGTSVTSAITTSRISHLLNVGNESTIRFLSVEPQFGPIDLSPWVRRLDWVIQGGASGPRHTTKVFDVDWARSLRRMCSETGTTRYFLKQLGSNPVNGQSPIILKDGHGGDWDEWPAHLADLKVREMPISPSTPVGNAAGAAAVPSNVNEASSTELDDAVKRRRHEAAVKAWQTRRLRAKPLIK
jgi:protein gp37